MNDVKHVLAERESRYGSFADNARLSQLLSNAMRSKMAWVKLEDDQREALEMIQHKIARIINGNPDYADSWIDIAGYAMLIANRLDLVSSKQD